MRAIVRVVVISLVFTLLTGMAMAQQPNVPAPPETSKTYAAAADVTALIAKAEATLKPGQPRDVERILHLAPYTANLEYCVGLTPAAIHEHEAEFYYVIEGSGILTTGGKVVNEERTDAENLHGTAIEGGTRQAFAKGDFLVVPENTPHWVSAINGTVILMTMHVPRPVPTKP